MAKRFTRKTQGVNATVFVAKAINYTDDTTLATFIANAPVGEFAVIDGNNTVHTDAITSAEEFFFVMRTTQGIKRTAMFKLAEATISKKAYVAPVKQVSAIGWTGTGGAINNITVAVNQNYAIKVIETTEGNEPYPTWYYEYTTKTGDAIIDVMEALAKKINDSNAVEHKQNQRLVSAKVKADATYSAFAMTGTTPTMTFTNGSTLVTLGGTTPTFNGAVGEYLSIDTAATPSDSIGDIYKIVAASAGVSITLNRPYTGTTITLTEAEAEGTRLLKAATFVQVGLELTSLDFGTHFQLAVDEEMINADITYITAFNPGNGTYDQVAALEREGQTFAGDTTKNIEFTDKWGKMDNFAVSGETYDYYYFEFVKAQKGIGLEVVHQERQTVIIPVAKSAGTVDSTLDTLFGL